MSNKSMNNLIGLQRNKILDNKKILLKIQQKNMSKI